MKVMSTDDESYDDYMIRISEINEAARKKITEDRRKYRPGCLHTLEQLMVVNGLCGNCGMTFDEIEEQLEQLENES